MASTIDDVACLAGVSIKTVSRVVNREPNVRAVTREKVEAAIRELNYEPNPSARGLASRRSHLIGLLYDNLMAESTYVVNVQRGVLARCRNHGYELLIHPVGFHERGLRGLAEDITTHCRQTRIDGAILTPPLSDLAPVLETFDRLNKPFIRLCPSDIEHPSPCVHTNDRRAAARMTHYLQELGHRRIAFISGHPEHQAVAQREDGFRDAMAAAGLDISPGSVLLGDSTYESALEATRELLALEPRPTAIFAATDDMAAGVLRVAHELGIDVPGKLSVAGFDDSMIATRTWPALTTLRQPVIALAEVATDLLLGQMRGGTAPVHEIALDTELVVRESTGPAPR